MNKIILSTMIVALSAGNVFSAQKSDFGIFSLKAQELEKLCQKNIDETDRKLNKIAKKIWKPRFKNTALAVENILNDFQKKSNLVSFLSYVSPSKGVRDITSACSVKVDKFYLDIFSDEKLFSRFDRFTQSSAYKKLSPIKQKLTQDYIKGFNANGFLIKDPKDRERVLALNKNLSELETQFRKNITDNVATFTATKSELVGLSDAVLSTLKKDGVKYIVDTTYPVIFPVMKNAKNPKTRKKAVEIRTTRGGKENIRILKEILKTRAEVAKLMGFESHADMKLNMDNRMAKSAPQVRTFLDDLVKKLKPAYLKEVDILKQLKCDEVKCNDFKKINIEREDFRYFQERAFEKYAQVNEEDIKQYFPLDHVTQAMFSIYETLMGVKITEQSVSDNEKWHSDVKYFEVVDSLSSKKVGRFFIDLFPRDGKYGHAAVWSLRPGIEKGLKFKQLPLAAMVCNFNPPSASKPSLLTHDQVETYFHEFGHLIHNMVSSTEYASHSGTRVPRDFVEAPSQMLEHWVWDAQSLGLLSKHHKNGKPLPSEMLAKLLQKKDVNKAIWYSRQLLFGNIDMDFHSLSSGQDINIVDQWNKREKEILNFYPIKGTHEATTFGHLVGYDAGYYGYLWSEVYARDMFTEFEKHGVMNPKVGRKYRDKVLAPGGSKDPFDMLEDFLGRPSNADAFTKALSSTLPTSAYYMH